MKYYMLRLKHYFKKIILNSIINSIFCPLWLRNAIYFALSKGKMKGHIHAPCYTESAKIEIGKNSFINSNCKLYNDLGRVVIGDNCSIGYNVTFIAVTHGIGTSEGRASKAYGKDIVIEDGCWIGANTTILPGVTIRRGVIIGAGSVVVCDCEEDSLYAGNPAKKIKKYKN